MLTMMVVQARQARLFDLLKDRMGPSCRGYLPLPIPPTRARQVPPTTKHKATEGLGQ